MHHHTGNTAMVETSTTHRVTELWADMCNEMETNRLPAEQIVARFRRQKFREGKLGGNWLFTNDSILNEPS